MSFPVLPIFPESGLAKSVIPPIFIGLILNVYLTESLGWPFLSLMVPGYLAPIFILKPLSGFIIVLEALVSFVIMRLLSEVLSRTGIWSRMFGTDAFFTILLISILVKAVFEGYGLGIIGPWLNRVLPFAIDYRDELHGIGLVVVPLLTNLLWHFGLRRGGTSAAVLISLTYVLTRYVLIPYTNYEVSSFELMYEKIALDFMESPKFYIILIAGAGLAALNRHRLGWSAHGILIPALLGIAWFTPLRIMTTFFETAVILLVGRLIINSNWIGNRTIEGPRKIFILFSIGFALKMLIGFVVSGYYPGFEATDIYGYAYLLPTLMAVEMFESGQVIKVSRMIVQTSLAAALLGVSIGFGASLWLPEQPFEIKPKGAVQNPANEHGDLCKWLLLQKARLLPETFADQYDESYSHERDRFQGVFNSIRQLQDGAPQAETTLSRAAAELADLKYDLVRFRDAKTNKDFVIVQEQGMTTGVIRGWGCYVFALQPESQLVIEAPQPLSEANSFEAAVGLFMALKARALFVNGCFSPDAGSRGDVTEHRNNVFNVAHGIMSDLNIIQVRTDDSLKNSLAIEKDPKGELHARQFQTLIPELETSPATPDPLSVLRETAHRGFATLTLSAATAANLLSPCINRARSMPDYVEDSLLPWLLLHQDEHLLSGELANRYRAPSLLELSYLDRELLTPLAELPFAAEAINSEKLEQLRRAAEALDLEITAFHDKYTGQDSLILHRSLDSGPYWGLYIFRVGSSADVVIEAPNPATEVNTLRFGQQLYSRLQAAAFFISGLSKRAETNDPDVTDPTQMLTVFQLAHQVLQRENARKNQLLALQVRGFTGEVGEVLPDAVLSSGYEAVTEAPAQQIMNSVTEVLRQDGIEAVPFDGSPAMVRFGSHANAQMAYTEGYKVGGFAALWLSSSLRLDFTSPETLEQFQNIAASMGWPFLQGSLLQYLRENPLAAPGFEPTSFIADLQDYSKNGNAEYLNRLALEAASKGLTIMAFRDEPSLKDFLVCSNKTTRRVVMTLSLQPLNQTVLAAPAGELGSKVNAFIDGNAAALTFEGK